MKNADKFVCDNCGEIHIKPKDEHFPFEDNWTYLHNLNFKVRQNHYARIVECHFCKIKCLSEYIMKKIMEEAK